MKHRRDRSLREHLGHALATVLVLWSSCALASLVLEVTDYPMYVQYVR